MRFIAEEISADTYISFMAQYFPAYRAKEHPRLKRVTSQAEYNEAAAALQQFGLGNGWLQGLEDTHC
jgi:putative pyruvate formate lyase activating enzyme